MAYAITQTCCTDASCVSACPVNCIHPTPGEPDFGTTDTLYIDPRACIDCGACADACPVDAVVPVDRLTGADAVHAELNRAHFDGSSRQADWDSPDFPRSLPPEPAAPRVAVVGTGPAAGYAVQRLLRTTDAEITVLDRAPEPGGLIRYGVAPDHGATKGIGRSFARSFRHPRVSLHLGVEVGRDVGHAELAAHHHAVIYAVGAPGRPELGVAGEGLPGSVAAVDFVGWCNGRPDAAPVDLSGERAVIAGTGNVALDVARLLLSDPDSLAETGIAVPALEALRRSEIREVVLLARRGPRHLACTRPEFLDLRHRTGAEVVVDQHGDLGDIPAAAPDSAAGLLRELPVEPVDWAGPPAGKRLVLRFQSAVDEVLGERRVRAVRAGGAEIPAGLLVRSIGSRGVPVPGVPFDAETGLIPNTGGRVEPGTYVVGWAKRGATGGIGANRACAAETVDALLDDAESRLLPEPRCEPGEFSRLLRTRTRRAERPRRKLPALPGIFRRR